MWTYHGHPPGINEIDVAEAHGGPFYPAGPFGKTNQFKVSYSLHAEPPPLGYPNPYGLQNDEVANSYPNQHWWNKVRGNYFDLDNWHTYTCDWDTAMVTTYLDGVLVNRVTKYYYYKCHPFPIFTLFPFFLFQTGCRDVPVFCYGATVPSIQYHTLRGFPYFNNSHSQLRFTTQMMQDETPYYPWTNTWDTSRYLKGEMSIDYVRIWQRHPEQDGHTDICNIPMPTVTGPNIVCSTATYTVSSGLTGTWTANGLNIVSQTPASVTVQAPTAMKPVFGSVNFNFQAAATCPVQSTSKLVDVGPPNPFPFAYVNIIRVGFIFPYCFYSLMVQNTKGPFSPTSYQWDVNYGPSYGYHLSSTGPYLITQMTGFDPNQYGGISGSVVMSNACGARVIYFSKANSQAKIVKVQGDDSTSAQEVSWYNALITDTNSYKDAIEARIGHIFLPDSVGNDTLAYEQSIFEIMADELEPYLLLDSSQMRNYNMYVPSSIGIAQNAEISRAFPNPTTGIVSILPGVGYDKRLPVVISVTDIYGHAYPNEIVQCIDGRLLEFDMSKYVAGIYTLSLIQGTSIERIRVVKQ